MKKYDLTTGEMTKIRNNTKYYTNTRGTKITLNDITNCIETNIYVCGYADDVLIFKDHASTGEILETLTMYNNEIAGICISEYSQINELICSGNDYDNIKTHLENKIMKEWKVIVNYDSKLEELKAIYEKEINLNKLYVNYFDDVVRIACPKISEDHIEMFKTNGINNIVSNFDILAKSYHGDIDTLTKMYVLFQTVKKKGLLISLFLI